MTTIFKDMKVAGMPEHIIDYVAKRAYKCLFRDVINSIITFYNLFEKIFVNFDYRKISIDEMIIKLKRYYPEVTIKVKIYNYSKLISIIKLTDTKFILFYFYDRNTIIAQCDLDNNNTIIFNRFYNIYHKRSDQYPLFDTDSIADYLDFNDNDDYIIQDLINIALSSDNETYTFKTSQNAKAWSNIKKIEEWFFNVIINR